MQNVYRIVKPEFGSLRPDGHFEYNTLRECADGSLEHSTNGNVRACILPDDVPQYARDCVALRDAGAVVPV